MTDERDISGRDFATLGGSQAQPEAATDSIVAGTAEAEATRDSYCERRERLRSILELLLVLVIAFGISIFISISPLFGSAGRPALSASAYSLLYRTIELGGGLALLIYVLVSPPSQAARGLTRDRLVGFGLAVVVAFFRPTWNVIARLMVSFGASGVLMIHLNDLWRSLEMAVVFFVLGYLLHRRGRSFSDLGLCWDSKGAALAAPLFLAYIVFSTFQNPITFWLGQTFVGPGWTFPDIGSLLFRGHVQITTVANDLINGFFEELIVRAFLMTVILKTFGRPWLAIALSVAVQVSYHFYQGVPLALGHIPLFTLYAWFYARTRLILPVALAHSLTDLFAVWQYGIQAVSGF